MVDTSKHKWVDKKVSWEKVEGNTGVINFGETGFGTLTRLDQDRSMVIWGDNGIITSPVFSVDESVDGLKVVTNNSTYLVKVIE